MNIELYQAFAAQLLDAQSQVATVRTELEQTEETEDRELAACLREKIAGLEKYIETIRHSEAAILASESELQSAAEKFARWRVLVGEVRAKAVEFDAAARTVRPASEALVMARASVTNARNEMALHLAARPNALALQKEIAAFDKETARLQTSLDFLIAEMQKAGEREVRFRATALKLRDELSNLTWREDRVRPASLSRQSDGSGLFRVAL